MPPYKSPPRLYQMCLETIITVVDISSHNLQVAYGSYNNVKCQINTAYVSELLLRDATNKVVDDLCDARRFCDEDLDMTLVRDVRIKLAILMHPNLTKFTVDLNSPEECQLPIYDPFWSMQFTILSGLTALDLTYAACDPVIRVVAKNCKLLEELTMVSAIPETCVVGKLCQCSTVLTSKGLIKLTKCQKLKKIIVKSCEQSTSCHVLDDERVPLHYLLGLPNLVYFPYTALGGLITRNWDRLSGHLFKLTQMWDCDPQPMNIENIILTCPYIQRLELVQSADGDSGITLNALERLADLNPPFPELVLRNIPVAGPTLRALQRMGPTIRALFFSPSEPIDSVAITLIASFCPGIVSLELEHLGSEAIRHEGYVSDVSWPFLTNLSIVGYDWDPYIVLPMVLKRAPNISKLRLKNITSEDLFIGRTLEKLSWSNPMVNLTSAKFNSGLLLSRNNLWHFLEKCPLLRELAFLSHPGIEDIEIDLIMQRVQDCNLDLDISYRPVEDQAEEWGDYSMIF